jgi:hypothetical protein
MNAKENKNPRPNHPKSSIPNLTRLLFLYYTKQQRNCPNHDGLKE